MSSTDQSTRSGRSDSQRNRQSIIEAATVCLLENPTASMGQIAERAGLTRATLYRHFPDRGDLVLAVAVENAAPIAATILEEMRALPWPEAVDFLADNVVRLGFHYVAGLQMFATNMNHAVRIAVADEPILLSLGQRRAAGEIGSELPDEWLALSIRALCVGTLESLLQDSSQRKEVKEHLARSIIALCT